ncbi:hypothetical protein [Metabacillus schmidteae]|uniref:hypothetical protein n=1 Tax=Metabacillus schmidteae TaxID=2730405 RepID=UPI00158C9603|nr:hypothetical protein [Metabacillus schmidteae]
MGPIEEQNDLKSADPNIWITIKEASNLYNHLSPSLLFHLIDSNSITYLEYCDEFFILKNDLNQLSKTYKFKKTLTDEYITREQLYSLLLSKGDELPIFPKLFTDLIEKICKVFKIRRLYFKDSCTLDDTFFYNKKDVLNFRSSVFSFNEVLTVTSLNRFSLGRIVEKNDLLKKSSINYQYIDKKAVLEVFRFFYDSGDWINRNEAERKYKITISGLNELINKGFIKLNKDHNGFPILYVKDIEKIAFFIKNIKENYLSFNEAYCYLLNKDQSRVSMKEFISFCNENNVRTIYNPYPLYLVTKQFFLKQDIFYLKETFYSYKDVCKINSISKDELHLILDYNPHIKNTVKLNELIPASFIKTNNTYFSKKYLRSTFISFDEVIKKLFPKIMVPKIEKLKIKMMMDTLILKGQYISKWDALEFISSYTRMLNQIQTPSEIRDKYKLGRDTFQKIKNEENLKTYHLFPKGNVFEYESYKLLINKINTIKRDYCDSKTALTIFNLTRNQLQKLKPVVFSTTLMKVLFKGCKYIYAIQDVYELIKKEEKRTRLMSLDLSSGFEAFKEILKIEKIYFDINTLETEQYWYGFVENKLHNSEASKNSFADLVRIYARCTKLLVNTIKDNELKDITTNTLNTHMFNYDIAKGTRLKLIAFINVYHKLLRIKNQKTKFKVDKLLDPNKQTIIHKEKELYSYEEFNSIYDYANNLEHHKNKAIDDALHILSNEKTENAKFTHYASSWMYILAHLNNAWRHNDIIHLIPRVDLSILGIETIEEFRDLNLTEELTQRILLPLKLKKYQMSKNKMFNHFHCSDQLAASLATAAIICTFIANKLYPEVISDKGQVSTNLITFGNNRNLFMKEISDSFFGDLIIKFENRKMNRTLLVIMYLVLVKKGKGSQALEVAKRLRGHFDFETTNIYLVIPDKELDFLVDNIFKRGSFGYIPNLLANVLFETDESNRAKRTEEIIAIKKGFGGLKGVEATSGFLLSVLSEKRTVADMILKMGRKEASDLLFSLNANLMPSKEENIQCIFSSESCKKPERENCQGCPFSIPNYYAILQIIKSIKHTMKGIVDSFEQSEMFPAERTKLANQFAMYMDALMDAYSEFGSIIFDFFNKNVDDTPFGLAELNNIYEDVMKFAVNGKSVESYLTYSSKYRIEKGVEMIECNN